MQINRKEKSVIVFFMVVSVLCFVYLSVQSADFDKDIISPLMSEKSVDNSFSEDGTPDLKYLNRVLDQIKYLSFF